RIIPGYNAKIDETTGKYTAAKEALDKYLISLEKEMRYKANEAKLQELTSAAEAARDAYDEAEIKAQRVGRTRKGWFGITYSTDEARDAAAKKAAYQQAEADRRAFVERMTKAINDGLIVPPSSSSENTVEEVLDRTNTKASETVTRLREINQELKQLRKLEPTTDDEYNRIRERIELLTKEKNLLMGRGSNRRTPGTYKEDSIDQVTAPVDDAHQKRLLAINKEDMSAADRTIAKNRELIQYCYELDQALEKLKSETDATHTQTLDKIQAEQNRIAQQVVTAQNEINKAQASKDATEHSERLKSLQVFYEHYERIVRTEVKEQLLAEEAAEIDLMVREQQYHNDRLAELQRYYNQVSEADYLSTEERNKLLKKIGADIRNEQSTILTGSAKFAEKLRGLMTDTTSAAGITNAYKKQRGDLIQTYDAMIAAVAGNNDQVVALEAEKNRRLAALDYEHQEQMFSLQELTGLSWSQEYDRELAKLENMHQQGLIDEKDYQKARLQLQVNNAKKYFDYYSQMAGSMFTALQDAEIAQSDAKYDVLIQQAKNNGEDTAALEEEKENKKLEIQKKYADVDFAIKISEIIANTAVAIMTGFKQLGPIGGAVAAAMLTATGVAQVMTAKAERDKIKNMSPSNTAGKSSSPAKAERVLSGYSEGGYTGDGDRYEVAGVVHRGEYVVPKPIMSNPRVVDAVGTIEAIRRGRIGNPAPVSMPMTTGYADGGYTGDSVQVSKAELGELNTTLQELREGIKNIRAYIVFRDLDKAQATMDRSRNPFTLNK
ncbi:MAG: hypothetical protein K2H98_02820, partial [Duncaniella sp.]|nr:hypothetical protein [Duncaniella sp.]